MAGAVLEGRVESPVGFVGQRPGAEPADDVRGGRIVGHHRELGDGGARDRGGDGVREEGEHELVVGVGAEGLGQGAQPRLGEGEPLRRDDDRPLRHGSM